MQNPKISFVVTARNDNYGENWINRINTFIKMLIHVTTTYQTHCELVFVEYNPVQGKRYLAEDLTIQNNEFLQVRFIVVPPDFHQSLPGHERVTVCEFIAKNIGIRRANGEYILATNPDVIFTEELFAFMVKSQLGADTFYRINRRDLSTAVFNPRLSPKQIYRICPKKTTKILYNDATIYVSYLAWLDRFIHGRNRGSWYLFPWFNRSRNVGADPSKLHENAAGDFLLMHRSMWEKVRGYDEDTVGSGIMDSYVIYMLHCNGYQQKILPYPLYHINHKHGKGKYIASYEKFRADAEQMLKTKKPYKEYSPSWGAVHLTFQEIIR